MLAVTLVVVVIAQNPELDTCEPGVCGGPSMISAFQRAVQRVLGSETKLRTSLVSDDPPDADSAASAGDADGVVELSFTPEGHKARLHCFVAREKRWLDREITFGESRGSLKSETSERGRLLGFAVATMYAGDSEHEAEAEAEAPVPPAKPVAKPPPPVTAPSPKPDTVAAEGPAAPNRRTAEFAVLLSNGLGGPAAGLGASAAVRVGLLGPVSGRLFIAGRGGSIPKAQATTRTALLGAGLALGLLPRASSFELGLRLDGFASYFDASHLSEDDDEPARRSRWQAGGDAVVEGGYHLTPGAGLFLGGGLEAMLGKTEIYTHQTRVAVVPPFRAVAELGFRTQF